MGNKLNRLIEMMAEQLSPSDLIAAEQLAKVSTAIAKKRIEMNMNQIDFAKFMDVSQGMISKWESEEYNFTVETLAKISEKLDLELDISLRPQAKKVSYGATTKWDCSLNGRKMVIGE